MPSVIPDYVAHLRTQVVLSNEEMEKSSACNMFKYAMNNLTHKMLCGIADKCYMTMRFDRQVILALDAYVFTRDELLDFMAKCREEGRKDAMENPPAENTSHDA